MGLHRLVAVSGLGVLETERALRSVHRDASSRPMSPVDE
jgi:hypothetical protein